MHGYKLDPMIIGLDPMIIGLDPMIYLAGPANQGFALLKR